MIQMLRRVMAWVEATCLSKSGQPVSSHRNQDQRELEDLKGDSEGDVHNIAGCKRLVAVGALPASRFIALFNACDTKNVATTLDNCVFEVHTADVANGEGLHAHSL